MIFDQFRNGQTTPLHSSGYAKAANGDSMGVVSSQSFQQRQNIERNRRAIGRYSASSVAQGNHLQNELRRRLESPGSEQQADTTEPGYKSRNHSRHNMPRTFGGTRETLQPGGQTGTSKPLQVPGRKTSFREPPTRGFNPYG